MRGYAFYTILTILRLMLCPIVGHKFKAIKGKRWADGERITHVCWCGAELTEAGLVRAGTRGVMG